jgi:hypothetical protein
MIEVYYLAHNNPKQSRILSGSCGFITAKTANYVLGIRDKRVKVHTVEDRKNATLYSIRAESEVWEFYAQRS